MKTRLVQKLTYWWMSIQVTWLQFRMVRDGQQIMKMPPDQARRFFTRMRWQASQVADEKNRAICFTLVEGCEEAYRRCGRS